MKSSFLKNAFLAAATFVSIAGITSQAEAVEFLGCVPINNFDKVLAANNQIKLISNYDESVIITGKEDMSNGFGWALLDDKSQRCISGVLGRIRLFNNASTGINPVILLDADDKIANDRCRQLTIDNDAPCSSHNRMIATAASSGENAMLMAEVKGTNVLGESPGLLTIMASPSGEKLGRVLITELSSRATMSLGELHGAKYSPELTALLRRQQLSNASENKSQSSPNLASIALR